MDLTIKVKRGVRTEIPLQIYGRRDELLKFLIRTPPEHGKITEPQRTGKETATVTYDPPADLNITHDRFFFSVQASEGVSSPVEVTITITDALPILAIPGAVDFPKILAGTTTTKTIELSNRGGGLAVGEMVVDPPWRIAGSSTYRIGTGEVAAFKLVFEPKEGRVFEGAVSFSSNREHSTLLRGEAFTPLSVLPANVVMENNAGDPVRTGSFEISNQTDQSRTLQIRSDARLLMPERVSIPSHGKVTIPIQTLAADVDAIDAEIRIESDGFSMGVPVKAAALGPMFTLGANRVLLGRQPATKPGTGSLVIENTGGLPGDVILTVAAPFVADPSKVVVNAGEKKSIQITLASSPPGKYRTWLEVKGGRQEFEVGLEAELYASAAQKPVASGDATGASTPEGEISHPDSVLPGERRDKNLVPILPKGWGVASAQAPGVKLLQSKPNSVTFEWPDKLSPATRFRFELRHLGLDASRELRVSWTEHPSVTVQHENGRYIATLADLRPSEISAVQVLPLNDQGEPGPRIFALSFSTAAAYSSTQHISPLQWLLLALLVCVGAWVWRAVRSPATNYL